MDLQLIAIVAACLLVVAFGLVAYLQFIRKRGANVRRAACGLAVAFAVMLVCGLAAFHVISWQVVLMAGAAAPIFGAVTVTPITAPSGQNPLHDTYVAQVAATADGDVAATITHNFGLTSAQQPFTEVDLTLLQSPIAAASPNWSVSARGANTVTLTKNATAGTGVSGVQVEARVKRPHTIGL